MWYKWKLGRFAWAEHVEWFRTRGVDLDGEWIKLFGNLWWLQKPR